MNRSRSSDDHELSHHRISAKSRYSTTSYLSDATLRNALATPAEEDNKKKPKRTTFSSKGGINGREDYDDEDELLSGLNGSRAVREANKKHAAATAAMNDLEKDINLARSASTSSAASASRDRPWRQASSGAGSSASTSSYTTAASSSDRWAQYETEDLAEESRRATSKAVVNMATRIANEEADKYEDEYAKLAPASPSSSSRSSQYRDDPLQDNGNSLSPSTSSFNKRSTTDYVKNRLSTLLAPDHRNSTRAQSDSRVHYDDVRSEAMKMLQLADESLSGMSDSPNRTTGLFRTSGGGLAMRELDEEESSGIEIIKGKQAQASISGLDSFKSSERGSIPKFDGTFTIGSHDEEDNHVPTNSKGGNKDGDTPSLWSSRYSVERQLMAITGGLDSAHMLNKMDKLHASREKTKSARGLYRASADAMDGSGEDYVDYTRSYSLGVHLGGVWQWFKGTMWSDISVNYDGTTQSLVRAEKARIKRRRIIIGSVFMVLFLTIIGVLVKKGNRVSPNTVNFYVLSDEPYDMTDLRQLTRDLENLPKDAEFVIHLGNANANEQSQCQEYGFERAASVLKECPVPMFVITGDKDWAACGSEKAAQNALSYWNSNLGQFDKNWEHDFDVHYQGEVVGNFAFLHKGVLFLSVNIVDVDTKPSELTDRHERNVMWTKEQIAKYSGDDYRAIVIFGHSHPSDDQGEYFWPVIDQIKHIDQPVLYVHANKHGNFEVYTPFEEAENFRAVQLERQGEEAPMKVTVLDKKSDPFKILRKSH
jgi:predicted phosphodiesterase